MRAFWKNNRQPLIFITGAVIIFRLLLLVSETIGTYFISSAPLFLGPMPWANFDGVHYLTIAEYGYGNNYQAFFPLFPLLIRLLSIFFGGNYLTSSLFVVHVSLVVALILLVKLISIDFPSAIAKWGLLFFLFFPTSFFFGSIYTESLFLALVLGSFYAARKQKWFLAGLLGGFASMTRIVGIAILPALLWEWWEQEKLKVKSEKLKINNKNLLWLLFIPAGLFTYMFYQYIRFHDALAFIHIQPGFGANRTGGEIILLPQVIFRYIKIFATVPWSSYDLWIALLEFFAFFQAIGILFFFRKRLRMSYLLFASLVVIVPTLTGSLSSMPRYILAAFPIFIALTLIRSKRIKMGLIFSNILLLILLAALFTRGYFVA